MLSNKQIAEYERIARESCGSIGRRAMMRLLDEISEAQRLLHLARPCIRDRAVLTAIDNFFRPELDN